MVKTIKKNYSKTLLALASPLKFFIIPFLLMGVCLLSGCLKTEDAEEIIVKGEFNPETTSGQEVEISIKVPETVRSATKALTDIDECHIENVEILIFTHDKNKANRELVNYRRSVNITPHPDPDSISVKIAKVYLPEGTYDFVFLANAKKWVNTSYKDKSGMIPSEGDFYEEIGQQLKATLTTGEGWNLHPDSSNYNPIPMYGEKDSVTINEQNKQIDRVTVDRILAKVDIVIEPVILKLHTVRLYNYNMEGYLFPEIYYATDDTSNVKLSPNHPILRYDTTATQEFKSTIYLFEFKNLATLKNDERFCFVIGGEYNNEGGRTYYRIDLKETGSFIDLKRNHEYTINITSVNGPGWPDEDLAYNGIDKMINYTITDWEIADIPSGGL